MPARPTMSTVPCGRREPVVGASPTDHVHRYGVEHGQAYADICHQPFPHLLLGELGSIGNRFTCVVGLLSKRNRQRSAGHREGTESEGVCHGPSLSRSSMAASVLGMRREPGNAGERFCAPQWPSANGRPHAPESCPGSTERMCSRRRGGLLQTFTCCRDDVVGPRVRTPSGGFRARVCLDHSVGVAHTTSAAVRDFRRAVVTVTDEVPASATG